ncbi:hypothetical protein MMC21_007578 [Puttea exsequens]|nr:hypothetical protein [Puttea exsequens]
MLVRDGVDIDAEDIYGETPLCLAARFGNLELVETFTERKANLRDEFFQVVNSSQSKGCPIGAKNEAKKTVIQIAIEADHADVVYRLFDIGATLASTEQAEELAQAVQHQLPETISVLLANGIPPNQTL